MKRRMRFKVRQSSNSMPQQRCVKTFIADDKYDEVIRYLQANGWKRVHIRSPFFRLAWVNYTAVRWTKLRDNQIVNHIRNSIVFSQKDVFAKAMHEHAKHTTALLPDTFILDDKSASTIITDIEKWANFYASMNVLKQCTQLQKHTEMSREAAISAGRYCGKFTCDNLQGHDISRVVNQAFDDEASLRQFIRSAQSSHPCVKTGTSAAHASVWICKPANLSQGRGIQVTGSPHELITLLTRLAKESSLISSNQRKSKPTKWVVQKYIERPLLLQGGRKFDIRQWVLISQIDPLEIYWYNESYLRFCSKPFSLDESSLKDAFRHLSNYSIQKQAHSENDRHGTDDAIFESMWSLARFQRELVTMFGQDKWTEEILPQMKQAATKCILACQDQLSQPVNGFEWLGFDFLIDETLHVWLLEVNVSPDLSHSTPVTSKLVTKATADALQLLLGNGKSLLGCNGWERLLID